MSREADAEKWVDGLCAEATQRDPNGADSPAVVAIAELLGGLVIEVAALNDHLAQTNEALSPLVEL